MDEQNVQTEALADTTPADETAEPSTETETEEATPADTDTENAEGTEGEGKDSGEESTTAQTTSDNTENKTFMTLRYNHEDVPLSEDEARRLAQLGKRYEAVYDRLDYGAALSGKSVDKFVDDLISVPENEYRKHLEEMYGEGSEDVEIGMNIWREKQKADYRKVLESRRKEAEQAENEKKEDTRSRLADEYIELKGDIPDAPEYNALPDSVIAEAASGKRDLLSAYLRYMHKEKKQIDVAQKTEEAAKSASTGQMNSEADKDDSLIDAFIKGAER